MLERPVRQRRRAVRWSSRMKTVLYLHQRLAQRSLTLAHVAEALAHEVARTVQPDGRTRVFGWVASLGQYLRVVLLEDGETILNAFPDRDFSKAHPPP